VEGPNNLTSERVVGLSLVGKNKKEENLKDLREGVY
jgi:hypothetical protein